MTRNGKDKANLGRKQGGTWLGARARNFERSCWDRPVACYSCAVLHSCDPDLHFLVSCGFKKHARQQNTPANKPVCDKIMLLPFMMYRCSSFPTSSLAYAGAYECNYAGAYGRRFLVATIQALMAEIMQALMGAICRRLRSQSYRRFLAQLCMRLWARLYRRLWARLPMRRCSRLRKRS
jgi:hypothetical protein